MDASSAATYYGFAAGKIISLHGYLGSRKLALTDISTEALLQASLAKQKLSPTHLSLQIV